MELMKVLAIVALFFCFAFTSSTSLPERWDRSSFPTSWLVLTKHKKDYIIRIPCEGLASTIALNADTLNRAVRPEACKHLIRSFERKDDDHYVLHCYAVVADSFIVYGVSAVDYEITVIDRQKKLVRWDEIVLENKDTTTWMMTPAEYSEEFKMVEQVCKPKKGAFTMEF